MKNLMFKTKINSADNKSTSIRVTIPKQIREFLELKPGNELAWIITTENNKTKIYVEKYEKNNKT